MATFFSAICRCDECSIKLSLYGCSIAMFYYQGEIGGAYHITVVARRTGNNSLHKIPHILAQISPNLCWASLQNWLILHPPKIAAWSMLITVVFARSNSDSPLKSPCFVYFLWWNPHFFCGEPSSFYAKFGAPEAWPPRHRRISSPPERCNRGQGLTF